jgi:hypothetical protein
LKWDRMSCRCMRGAGVACCLHAVACLHPLCDACCLHAGALSATILRTHLRACTRLVLLCRAKLLLLSAVQLTWTRSCCCWAVRCVRLKVLRWTGRRGLAGLTQHARS